MTAVDAVEEVDPVSHSGGHGVELHAIDEGKWSSVDTLARGVFPYFTDLPCSVVGVIRSVRGLNISLIKTKFVGDLLGPPWDEIIL